MALDYRRGFRRLYFALAIPWTLVCLALTGLLIWGARDNYGRWSENDLWLAAKYGFIAVIPPAIVYAMSFVVVPWIARGFKPPSTNN